VARQDNTFGEIMLCVVDDKIEADERREVTLTSGHDPDELAAAANPE
jgi:hypothetical protein